MGKCKSTTKKGSDCKLQTVSGGNYCHIHTQNECAESKEVVSDSVLKSVGWARSLENTVLFPFRLFWNIIVTGLLVGGFVLWFGFIFGSVVAVVLILIFAPELFLLPLPIAYMYTNMWPDE